MKKFIVIGNPIKHSLSPQLHNYWINKNNINAIYEKKEIKEEEISSIINQIKQKEINGINVTVPFKKTIIRHLDELSEEAEATQSVNTVCLEHNKVVGYNTDIKGFELGIKNFNIDLKNKIVLILGSGGVVSSIIYALKRMRVSKIIISNRTKENTNYLKKLFEDLIIVDWGEIPEFDIVINATSVGLKKEDNLKLNFSKVGKNKFFYDVIYNPSETQFLKTGKDLENKVENGKYMFIYQAFASFKLWHGIDPEINSEVIKLLDR